MKDAYQAHEWLKKFYSYILLYTKEGKEAKNYLLKRGISEETMKAFKIGFSPRKASSTLTFLKGKKFSYRELVKQKVLYRYSNGNLTDPFKNRIVFPINDYQGRTVAFGGRTMDKNNKVKYYNTPETRIFKKGDNLFGFDLAKEEITNQGFAILLEGYFDVVTLHQHGIKNGVASLGTSLTTNQAILLKNVTNNIVITYDGDEAGKENAFRSASVLKSVGCNVLIAYVENELDPDEYVKKYGSKKFIGEVILKAKDTKEAFIGYKKNQHDLSCAKDRFLYVDTVLRELSSNDVHEQEKLLKMLGDTLNVSLDNIYNAIKS